MNSSPRSYRPMAAAGHRSPYVDRNEDEFPSPASDYTSDGLQTPDAPQAPAFVPLSMAERKAYAPAPLQLASFARPPSPIIFDTEIWGGHGTHNMNESCPPPIALPSLFVQLDDQPQLLFPTQPPSPMGLDFSSSQSLSSHASAGYATHPPPSPYLNSPSPEPSLPTEAALYNPRFPARHHLNETFVSQYALGDELGAGGYGFVMTAACRTVPGEVAVKFIIKDKVPSYAWVEDELYGKVPTEVMLVSVLDHENIVRCLDVFEDEVYFYLVQELHGSPWVKKAGMQFLQAALAPAKPGTPSLSPSSSYSSLDSAPHTPAHGYSALDAPMIVEQSQASPDFSFSTSEIKLPTLLSLPSLQIPSAMPSPSSNNTLLPADAMRPHFGRRPSHDLFECIEQSQHKRLPESHARHIFAQVIEAVTYLDAHGVTHRDIKDENLVIDDQFRVKLIDFGSAVVADPSRPRPTYDLFFGTTAYAAPEILRREPYLAAPAEVWTLGVLLSFLLTGASPFQTERDAHAGRIRLKPPPAGAEVAPGPHGLGLSAEALDLMSRCLVVEPEYRSSIQELRSHPWLRGALRSPL